MTGNMSLSEAKEIEAASAHADYALSQAKMLASQVYDFDNRAGAPLIVHTDLTEALVHEIRALRLTLDALLENVEGV